MFAHKFTHVSLPLSLPPFLPFCTGPTGVGKSELAKALAQELFDDEKHMVCVKGGEGGPGRRCCA